jgi:hypothetical protein
MALATIREQLELPGGVAPRQVRVSIDLVTVGYTSTYSVTAAGVYTATPDADGLWSVENVRPNVGASSDVLSVPEGNAYRVTVTAGSTTLVPARVIEVPDSAGPHWVGDLLTTTPGNIPAGAPHSALVLRDASDAHPISAITGLRDELDAAQPIAEKGQPSGYASLNPAGVVPQSQIDAARTFTNPAALRWSGGGTNTITVRSDGDGAGDGVFNLLHNASTGYIFHLVGGPGLSGNAAIIGIGIDHGGRGILLNNKSTGVGLNIVQNATISTGGAYGMLGDQRSALAPIVRWVASVDDFAPLVQYKLGSWITPAANTRMVEWRGVAGEDMGHVAADTGHFVWRNTVRVISPDSSTIATVDVRDEAANASRVHVRSKASADTGLRIYRYSGSGVSFFPWYVGADGSSLKMQVASGTATHALGAETMQTIIEAQGGADAKLGVFGATPIAKPTVSGTRAGGAGPRFVNLATAGDHISTPDTPSVDLAGDWTLIVDRDGDWTPTTDGVAVAQWTAVDNQRGVRVVVRSTGAVRVLVTTDGTSGTISTLTSSAALPFSDGTRGRVAVTRRASDGRIQIFTATDVGGSPESVAWTQLGSDLTGPTGALHASTTPLTVGQDAAGTPLDGDYYRVQVRDGNTIATSTLAADMWPQDDKASTTTMIASTGETWTLQGAAAWGGENAIDALIDALATLGLITDGSTA